MITNEGRAVFDKSIKCLSSAAKQQRKKGKEKEKEKKKRSKRPLKI